MTVEPTSVNDVPPADDRRVALALHAMTPVDRGWMLSRLPASSHGQLREWLDELDALGVPRDPSLLATVRAVSAVRPHPDGTYEAMIAHVAVLEPEVIANILRRESVPLVAALLGISDWPWRQSVMHMLGASHARRVAEATMTARVPPAPARDAALLQAMLDRAAGARQAHVPAGRAHGTAASGRARQHVAGLVALFSRKVAA
ncbi:hypothetical protein [Cupriavidus sp. SW-Y-13]|uniref:hypothetical protein n=1 Tax=Cupriavidus sp. SW-Y-13 TaxID=2653854 RepID=UPI001365CE0D|nr:hypothetical protein [Cupriavidus sp. SW-Y-13]MWL90525.1 hypothetical protein [Cupriavidus sp. SW-Y-13]